MWRVKQKALYHVWEVARVSWSAFPGYRLGSCRGGGGALGVADQSEQVAEIKTDRAASGGDGGGWGAP